MKPLYFGTEATGRAVGAWRFGKQTVIKTGVYGRPATNPPPEAAVKIDVESAISKLSDGN